LAPPRRQRSTCSNSPELAWQDCYSEIAPSEEIIDEILLCSGGDIRVLVQAAHLAVEDWRDLKMWAAKVREGLQQQRGLAWARVRNAWASAERWGSVC
jgi:hypothetical protein